MIVASTPEPLDRDWQPVRRCAVEELVQQIWLQRVGEVFYLLGNAFVDTERVEP